MELRLELKLLLIFASLLSSSRGQEDDTAGSRLNQPSLGSNDIASGKESLQPLSDSSASKLAHESDVDQQDPFQRSSSYLSSRHRDLKFEEKLSGYQNPEPKTGLPQLNRIEFENVQDAAKNSFVSRAVKEPPSRLISQLGGPSGDLPLAAELQPKFPASASSKQPAAPPRTSFIDAERAPRLDGDDLPSPYWLDPSGRPSSVAPIISPSQLAPVTYPCNLNGSVPSCDAFARFQRINGSCNNLSKPRQGMAGSIQQRLFQQPTDSTLMRRFSVTGRLLPNPRTVSEATKNSHVRSTRSDINLFFVFLGQFIDHDLVITPFVEDPQNPGKNLRCPNCSSWLQHPGCAPINVSPHDSFFRGPRAPACLPFTRSAGIPVVDSSGVERLEILNLNTAYLDLSPVYGSTDCLMRELRTFTDGQMHTTNMPSSPYGLPVLATAQHFDACRTESGLCYRAGDDRASEHAGLLVIHTLFLREHNHIARELKNINPAWKDELIFQESRRLNIAQYQHIVMNEFLPTLLGSSDTLQRYELKPPPVPFPRSIYNAERNAEVLVEFSTAAFRFGHTLVKDVFVLADEALRPMGTLPLVKVFDDPTVMQEPLQGTMQDALLRGLLSSRIEPPDLSIVTSLQDKLFVSKDNILSGQDLFARNIARGRVHGLSPYTAFRETCKLPAVKSWDDLVPIIPVENRDKLKSVYDHWDDIDLFAGGLSEEPVTNAVVGPTFACLISLQFYLTSTGDRFWYHGGPAGLSPAELKTVYASGILSKLIGRNFDNPNSLVPSFALRLPNVVSNPAVAARTFHGTDMHPWVDPRALHPKHCKHAGREYAAGETVNVSPCLNCHCTPSGYLQCQDRLIDCHALDAFVPGAREDEHCHRVCPLLLPQHPALPFIPGLPGPPLFRLENGPPNFDLRNVRGGFL